MAPPSAFAPLARHVVRRAEQIGRCCNGSASAQVAEPWRQVAVGLGVLDAVPASGDETRDAVMVASALSDADDRTDDPQRVAQRIAQTATGGVLVVAVAAATTWGREVHTELERMAQKRELSLLLVVIRGAEQDELYAPPSGYLRQLQGSLAAPLPAAEGALAVTLSIERLAPGDAMRWWDAVIAQDPFLATPCFEQLGRLDGWWESTRVQAVDGLAPERLIELEPTEMRCVEAVRLAQQPVPAAVLSGLVGASRDMLEALTRKGALVADDRDRYDARDGFSTKGAIDQELLVGVARSLAVAGADAWSLMRGAELMAQSADLGASEQLAHRALNTAKDTSAREDLWRRWMAVVTRGDSADASADDGTTARSDAQLARLLRSAEHALELGDSERADEMARHALGMVGERFDVLLVRGRSCAARGDLTTASLSLLRAIGIAVLPDERGRAAAELAEVRYNAGDGTEAERHALAAIDQSPEPATRLLARNVLGKLLLLREAWADANEHFAADAYEAAQHGLTEAELRARLNRGIALLSSGRRQDARRMYDEIRREGKALGHPRAVAYALSNLATIAILEHDYGEALLFSEEAIDVHRRLGDRVAPVRPITNLAELRMQLGLYDEADQALRFGMQSCGGSLPLSHYAYFAKAAAAIQLARGNTAEARNELSTARSAAASCGDVNVLAQCERIAARVALDAGDVESARNALVAAQAYKHTRSGQAEVAVIAAQTARAAGEAFLSLARDALAVASRADDPDSLRESYKLLYQAHRLEDDEPAAQSALDSALRERDRIVATLPEPLRPRYMARRCLTELAGYEAEREHGLEQRVGETTTGRNARAKLDPAATAAAHHAGRRLIGEASSMRALRGAIHRVAATDAAVLIHGPTGTGKELVAEALHQASPRSGGPLIKVNCAALVETLLLSELFGHEKGAFTGASARRRGRFEVADGGTLFLDEIGDISPRTQVALLRVLQDGTFDRVGGCTAIKTNVRVVCATHRDLKSMVERGDFREDLYYRLAGVVLEVPALKDRFTDLPLLASALLERVADTAGIESRSVSTTALRVLARHPWPGNVRELENALRVAALFARGPEIELNDFTDNVESLRELANLPASEHDETRDVPASSSTGGGSGSPSASPNSASFAAGFAAVSSSTEDLVYAEIRGGTKLSAMKKRLERECIARALVEAGGNITRAAALLGITRPRLSQLVKQYGLVSVLEDIRS